MQPIGEQGGPVLLTGKGLTLSQLEAVAAGNARVEIDDRAMEKVTESYELVLSYVHRDDAVYGLNRGVGLNKDRRVTPDQMERFNRNLIRSHCAGCGPDAPEAEVRAAMLVRLNAALSGYSGLSPAVVRRYAEFLNLGIHPVVPELGSVGEADIVLLPHIGLAMIGEGEVFWRGKRLSAAEALRANGLEPLRLGPKESLGIVSSNAFSAGKAGLAMLSCLDLLDQADVIYALSLEGIRGNVWPLDPRVTAARPEPGYADAAARMRRLLAGSELWNPDLSRPLQDPISFRSAPHIHGAARSAFAEALRQLSFHLNHSDDNPCVIAADGSIVPSAHFEALHWVLPLEHLAVAIAHVAKASLQRILRLGTPVFTGLPRFLSPDDTRVMGFATLQKTAASLMAEIRLLAQPTSLDSASLAGDMEDLASNAPLAARRLHHIVTLARQVLAVEMLHAAQAIHLRGNVRMGEPLQKAYAAVRSCIEPLEQDRVLTDDIRSADRLIQERGLIKACAYSTREEYGI